MPAVSVRLLLAGACLSAIATAAGAQTAPSATGTVAAADAAAPGTGIADIIVTATRREEIARNVPVAVSSISGAKLDELNASGLDIRFLSSRVPSLQIESSFGRTQPRFYIRGLGNTDFDVNAPQPVSVVYDDVALENSMLKAFPVFDLQSVQVLRGPQGTLFGRNTLAGVVKLDPKLPGTSYDGYAMAEYGTYNTINAEAGVGGPIGEGLSFRVSGILQHRDDWVKNDDTSGVADHRLEGYTDVAGRAQLQYQSGDFTARVEGHYRHLDGTPRVFRAGLFLPGTNDFNTGFDKDHVSLDGFTSQSLRQYGTNLHLEYDFETIGTLYSVTGYEQARVESTGDIDGGDCYSYLPGCTLGALNVGEFPDNTGGVTKPREFSQELRFASEEFHGLRFQAGAYYFHQKLTNSELAYDGPLTAGTTRAEALNQDIEHLDKNTNYGIFANVDYKPAEKLTLRAGVRYSHDHKHDIVAGYGPVGTVTSQYDLNGDGIIDAPVQQRIKGSDVTWDASATYALNDQVNFYGRLATGYQGPAIQDRVTFGSLQSTAPKETILSGEGGIKGTTIDHTLSFALDGYWFRARHFQITSVGGANNSAQLFSVNHVTGYGAELEVEARPIRNVTLTASGSYNFTQIHDPSILAGTCGGGCIVTDPVVTNAAGATGAVIDGNRLPQAPKFVANATFRYDYPLADGSKIFFDTDWAYRSSINYFLYEALEFRGRALTEGGAELGYQFANGLSVSVFARNITDQLRSISAIDFNNLTGMLNDPRIVGGKIRFAFK